MTHLSMIRTAAAAIAIAAGLGTVAATASAQEYRAQDFQAYVENGDRLASPHAYYHVPWPHFAKDDHAPHYDAWGRDLNGPPFRGSCDGLYYGTGDHTCGSMTGGPAGGLASRN